jgi:hypothetical protein
MDRGDDARATCAERYHVRKVYLLISGGVYGEGFYGVLRMARYYLHIGCRRNWACEVMGVKYLA